MSPASFEGAAGKKDLAAREFIVAELHDNKVIGEVTVYRASQHLKVEHVNHYVTDGEVAAATLVVEG